ncbi:biological adhesion [Branchiostoma belcheri]|nr:biological adhesion [Branchiostoma belcheri]
MSSTRSTTLTMEGITSAGPQRSTSSAISRPGTPSSSSNNTSGNSAGSASNQTATPSGAVIGGAAAAGVVVLIAIIVSIVFIRRRRSKPTDGKEPSPQSDEGTVDNIYYGGVAFAANGNASTNGHVSINQSEGMVDNNLYAYAGTTSGHVSTCTTDQSEEMVDNHLYAGSSTTNGTLPIDQSEGTVDNHLYAGTGDACLETSHYDGNVSAQDSVYYNVAHTSDEGVVENDIYC